MYHGDYTKPTTSISFIINHYNYVHVSDTTMYMYMSFHNLLQLELYQEIILVFQHLYSFQSAL